MKIDKKIAVTVLLTLMLHTAYAQDIVTHTSKQSCKETKQSNDTLKGDSNYIKRPTLLEEFKEARKHNKQNLKKASKFYNPLTLIFRLFGI